MGVNINSINDSTFKGWFLTTFDTNDIMEMVRIGPEHFGPFIYYSDTSMLYERFSDEIWELVGEVASMYYDATVLDVIAQKKEDIDSPARFECAMVRLAAAYFAHESALEIDTDADE